MTEVLNKEEVFNALPKTWEESLLTEISNIHKQSNRRLVILDDDPTGTQTVHGITLLTQWSHDLLVKELKASHTFFILTNTRSMEEAEAVRINKEIGENLMKAAKEAEVEFFVLSRSDSTLRGHYPKEVDALNEGVQVTPDATVLVPYFEAGGRFTIQDTHYVEVKGDLIPACQTEFAEDKSFPFKNSYLPKYVEEKTKGKLTEKDVYSIDLETIRKEGPSGVYTKLMTFPKGGVIVINAAHESDLEVAVRGLLMAQEDGRTYTYRTAASFVKTLAGIETKPLLNAERMKINTTNGGVMFVGSYIKKSSEQLSEVLKLDGIVSVEVQVNELLSDTNYEAILSGYAATINTALKKGNNVVVYTSRNLVSASSPEESLKINRRVSSSIVKLVQSLSEQPKFLIAKGGITSNDIATKGLGVVRALVAGQLQPGVPVWLLGEETKFPNMHYVVYPGNVGSAQGLADAIKSFSIA